ncbi:hypothetical protein AB0L63_17795 [Nocardia sp. NPDC051990]
MSCWPNHPVRGLPALWCGACRTGLDYHRGAGSGQREKYLTSN